MLDLPDTERVKRWLESRFAAYARAHGSERGLATQLAKHCDVSHQAIVGWRTTGRITKTNLAKVAAFFGDSPDFLLGTGLATNDYRPARSDDDSVRLTQRERDVLLAFRQLPVAEQRELHDELMSRAQRYTAYLEEVLFRQGVNLPLSDRRIGDQLPTRPDGEQADTEPAPLGPRDGKR